jgi:hypothetical protein
LVTIALFFSPTFVQDLTKEQKRKYDYSKQKMDTADRDCRLYSVDGILQAGIGCGSEIFFLCSNADRSGGQRVFFFLFGDYTRAAGY